MSERVAGHDRVVETEVAQPLVALAVAVRERGVLVAAEHEDCLIQMRAIEGAERNQELEFLDRQARDCLEQVRLDLGYDVVETTRNPHMRSTQSIST